MLPTPPEGFDPLDKAEDLIAKYLTGGKYDSIIMPKRLKRADVDAILDKTLAAKEIKTPLLRRLRLLVAYYDVAERVGTLERFLTHDDKVDATFTRSLEIVGLLGDFGTAAQQATASKYFSELCGNALVTNYWPQVIGTVFYLPSGAPEQAVTRALTEKVKALEPQVQKDRNAAVAFYQLKDYLADRLPTVVKARKRREELAGLKDDHKRRLEIGQYYVGLQRIAYVDMMVWAMMELQRDCNRNDPPVMADEFIGGFDMIRSQAGKRKLTDGDVQDLNGIVTRCARAIDFYGGKFTPDRLAYFAEHDHSEQADILHWEPFDSKTKRG